MRVKTIEDLINDAAVKDPNAKGPRVTFHPQCKVLNHEELNLFPLLRWWAKNYTSLTGYDHIKVKGFGQPALNWGHLVEVKGEKGRSADFIDRIYAYWVLDFDNCLLSPEQFEKRLSVAGFHACWHESSSSRSEEVELELPVHKYHVFVEMDCEIDKATFTQYADVLLARVGSAVDIPGSYDNNNEYVPAYDPVCKDAARLMFLPIRSLIKDCHFGEVEGKPYPMKELLEEIKAESVAVDEQPTASETPQLVQQDVTRVEPVSMQPSPVIRDNAQPRIIDLAIPERREMVRRLLGGISFANGEEDKWKGVVYSIYSVMEGGGRDLLTEWHKAKCPKHLPGDEERIWKNAHKYASGYSAGTLFHYCKDENIKDAVGKDTRSILRGRAWQQGLAQANGGGVQQGVASVQPQGAGQPQVDEVTIESTPPDMSNMCIPKSLQPCDFNIKAWDGDSPEDIKSGAIEIENGIRVEFDKLARRLGRLNSTEPDNGVQGMETGGVIAMKNHMLIAAGTGVGKTTILSNFVMSFCNRKNATDGKPKNAIIFSMEDDSRMYTDKLVRIATNFAYKDGDMSRTLNEFFNKHGKPYIDVDKEEDVEYFNDIDEATRIRARLYPEGGQKFRRVYSDSAMQVLTGLLFRDNKDIGKITIPPFHRSLYADDIKYTVEHYEAEHQANDPDFKYDIVIVDYAQTLRYEGEDTGTPEAQGIRTAVHRIIEYCQANGKLCLMASQLRNNVKYTPSEPIGIDDIALSKNIANVFSTVLMFQRASYDKDYSTEYAIYNGMDESDIRKLDKVGVLRCNVVKSRETGDITSTNTEVLMGVCQRSYTLLPDYDIDADFVIANDESYKKNNKPAIKETKPAAGDDKPAGDGNGDGTTYPNMNGFEEKEDRGGLKPTRRGGK